MTTNTITLTPVGDLTSVVGLTDSAALELVERELGHPCDDLDEFEEALFRLGLAA